MNAPRIPTAPDVGGKSLIERAADAYGLDDFTRRPGRPVEPPPYVAPEPPAAFAEPRIHVEPVVEFAPEVAVEPELEPDVEVPAPVARPRVIETGDVVAIDRTLLAEGGNIVPGAAASVLAEEFRLIKRQLLLTARGMKDDLAKARTILICSARPDEGKTFCAINLAISLAAERDTDVLLIDGDFAKRDLMPRMGLENGPGFLDALADAALDPERLVIKTDIPQLSLLAAGSRTNDDTELLASNRTRHVIDQLLAADPDRILLFDSPPALAASPAGVFALHVGQIMMVVRANSTSENEIRDAVALLDGCEHIQLVLNQVRHQPGGYRFGDYYAPLEETK